MEVGCRHSSLENSLKQFFKTPANLEQFLCIVERKNNLTLRKLERFITKDAREHNFMFKKKDGRIFRLYSEYRRQQNAFTKRLFDPFCRYDRVILHGPKFKDGYESTLGQLNFFRWAIHNEVLSYIIAVTDGKIDPYINEFKFTISFD